MNKKEYPMYEGLFKYFPDALREVSHVSFVGNEQHHPHTPVHWDKSKSTDEYDAMLRHLTEVGKLDDDGVRHSAKVAWRSLAALQREIEADSVDEFDELIKKANLNKIETTYERLMREQAEEDQKRTATYLAAADKTLQKICSPDKYYG